jgi:hypothetical protein
VAGLSAGVAIGALALARALAGAGIGGGWKRGVIGVAAQLSNLPFQPLEAPLEALHLIGQRQQNLDARISPRVIDRLGLGALHVARVRRCRRRAAYVSRSPRAGVTERLQLLVRWKSD